MKEIGFISLLLVFGILPVFGQVSNNTLQVLDLQQPNFKHGNPARGILIAQGVTAQNLEAVSDESTKQIEVVNGACTVAKDAADI